MKINEIDLRAGLGSESTLEAALDRMIELLSDKARVDEVIGLSKWDLFEVYYLVEGERIDSLEYDRVFFQEALKYEGLIGKVIIYCKLIIKAIEEYDEENFVDEDYFGSKVVLTLALQNREYIKYFIRFLRTNDLNHEVYQTEYIDELIKHYGFIDEIIDLAGVRMVQPGQGIDELKDNGIKELIEEDRSFREKLGKSIAKNNSLLDEYWDEDLYEWILGEEVAKLLEVEVEKYSDVDEVLEDQLIVLEN